MIFRKGKSKKDIDPIVKKWYKRWRAHAKDVIEAEIQKAFDTERHSNDRRHKWPHLEDSTVAQRKSLGYPGKHPILYRTGKLRREIEIIDDGDFVTVTSDLFYSLLLDEGKTGYKNGGLQDIKARRHLHIPDKFFRLETRRKLTNFDFYMQKIQEDLMKYVYKKRRGRKK